MAKIKKFNKTVAKQLAAEVIEALQPVLKKYDIQAVEKGGSFTETSFTQKVEFMIQVSEDENVRDREYKENLKYAEMYGMGLSEADYNKLFEYRNGYKNETYRFAGLNFRAKRYPIVAENMQTGEYTRFTDSVTSLVKKSKNFYKAKK